MTPSNMNATEDKAAQDPLLTAATDKRLHLFPALRQAVLDKYIALSPPLISHLLSESPQESL